MHGGETDESGSAAANMAVPRSDRPMARGRGSLCPLCGEPLVGELSWDHVFGKAVGGRITVRTHKACNNMVGSGAEGTLARPSSVLNLVRAVSGLSGNAVPAVAADGAYFDVDFPAVRMTPSRPQVRVERTEDGIRLYAEGSEDQLRGVVRDWRRRFGDAVPTFADLPPGSRQSVSRDPMEVTSDQVLDLEAAEAFLVKVALGAGSLAFGDEFLGGPVASGLRAWRDARFDNPLVEGSHRTRAQLEMLPVLDLSLRRYLESQAGSLGVATSQPPELLPPPVGRINSATFVPLPGSPPRTAIFVHALSFPIPPWGVVVEGALPDGQYGDEIAPVVVREEPGRPWEVVRWTGALLAPVVEAARRGEEEMHRGIDEISGPVPPDNGQK